MPSTWDLLNVFELMHRSLPCELDLQLEIVLVWPVHQLCCSSLLKVWQLWHCQLLGPHGLERLFIYAPLPGYRCVCVVKQTHCPQNFKLQYQISGLEVCTPHLYDILLPFIPHFLSLYIAQIHFFGGICVYSYRFAWIIWVEKLPFLLFPLLLFQIQLYILQSMFASQLAECSCTWCYFVYPISQIMYKCHKFLRLSLVCWCWEILYLLQFLLIRENFCCCFLLNWLWSRHILWLLRLRNFLVTEWYCSHYIFGRIFQVLLQDLVYISPGPAHHLQSIDFIDGLSEINLK